MRTDGHQTEAPETLYLVGIAIDEEGDTVPKILCCDFPTRLGRQERRMGRYHGANSLEDARCSLDFEPDTGGPHTVDDVGLRRHKFHVHEVSPQSCDIGICPIGIGVGAQKFYDLGHGGKGRLPGVA